MRIIGAVLLLVMWLGPRTSAEDEMASVCVAPAPAKPLPYFAPPGSPCDSAKLSLKIDALKPVVWPIKESVKIVALHATETHRVVIFCDGKPQKSFRFRFSDFKTRELCLFINGLYKTAQLWESKSAPWCKCKQS
jgi:hypothetical protein